MRELERVEEAPQAMGIDVIAIREGASIKLSLRLEAVVQGVLITGRAMAEASGECVRCLEPVTLPLDVYFQDLFTYEPDPRSKKTAQDFDDDDPLPELIDGMADLGPALVDAVVLNLPYQPLCRPDCAGLCPECGQLLGADPTHKHSQNDSRWANLSGLVFEDSVSIGDTEHLGDGSSSQREQEES